jgi:exosome complex component CSL4
MSKKDVIPGSAVGTEEEYVSGSGTYVEDANIYSTVSGMLHEDQRTLSVNQRVLLQPIHAGVTVLGRVENIVEPIALVSIMALPTDKVRYTEMPDYCVLHASRVKEGFVKNIRGEFRIGDIIKAKVIGIKSGEISLSTEGPELGVVKGFCAKCRSVLELAGGTLKCNACGNSENRKVSRDYRKLEL